MRHSAPYLKEMLVVNRHTFFRENHTIFLLCRVPNSDLYRTFIYNKGLVSINGIPSCSMPFALPSVYNLIIVYGQGYNSLIFWSILSTYLWNVYTVISSIFNYYFQPGLIVLVYQISNLNFLIKRQLVAIILYGIFWPFTFLGTVLL